MLPDLGQATFLGGINGRSLLLGGLVVCALGLVFGLAIYKQLKDMPVHRSMLEVSELIYETCKTYLQTQGTIPPDPVGVHRGRGGGVLRQAGDHDRLGHGRRGPRISAEPRRHHSGVQPDRHGRQLRGGLVRHPGEHLRQLPHGVREPRAASRTPATRSRSRRA